MQHAKQVKHTEIRCRDCVKRPDGWRTGALPDEENGSEGPPLRASRYQGCSLEGATSASQTVSKQVFSEVSLRKRAGVSTEREKPQPIKGGLAPKGIRQRAFATLLAHQETLRRTSSSAPMPEDISATLATRVTSPTSGGPPVLGSGVALAVALAVALIVALAVALIVALAEELAVDIALELAVLPPPPPP